MSNIFEEILTEIFLNLIKINPQIQKVQKIPSRINTKRPTTKYIMIKLLKSSNKEKTLRGFKEKKTHYIERIKNIRMIIAFSRKIQAKIQ